MAVDVHVRSEATPPCLSDRAELVTRWERLFKAPVPRHLSRQLLERSVAYRLQVLEHGAISKRVRDTMRAIAESRNSIPTRRPATGSQLIREWNGVLHVVDVLEESFEYRGRSYRSLTAVAAEITGGHWPGPRFFGLRRRCK
jgi:hypothetical protein